MGIFPYYRNRKPRPYRLIHRWSSFEHLQLLRFSPNCFLGESCAKGILERPWRYVRLVLQLFTLAKTAFGFMCYLSRRNIRLKSFINDPERIFSIDRRRESKPLLLFAFTWIFSFVEGSRKIYLYKGIGEPIVCSPVGLCKLVSFFGLVM